MYNFLIVILIAVLAVYYITILSYGRKVKIKKKYLIPFYGFIFSDSIEDDFDPEKQIKNTKKTKNK